MMRARLRTLALTVLLLDPLGLVACSKLEAASIASQSPSATSASTVQAGSTSMRASESIPAVVTKRKAFLGGFFRPQGPPPYGIFSSEGVAPNPYPTPGTVLFGNDGYCTQQDKSGNSIDGSFQIDTTKLNDLIFVGARWTRMTASQFFMDNSHIFGPGQYAFATLDAAQCISLAYHYLRPVIGLEAGPVNYNEIPGTFSPKTYVKYQTAADFGQWCGIVAAHEKAVFPSVYQYSLPGNEVNSDPTMWPGGAPEVAAYSKACYSAIKSANPQAFVYGFELNMEGSLNPSGYIKQMVALGCKIGTCYDGLAIHMTLQYPIPPPTAPCYPHANGVYGMQCITDVKNAVGVPVHILVSETVYTIPGFVPDEQTKGQAIVDEMTAFAADMSIDGVAYANIDECLMYPSGFFMNGCLIDTGGHYLTSFTMLQWFAANNLVS